MLPTGVEMACRGEVKTCLVYTRSFPIFIGDEIPSKAAATNRRWRIGCPGKKYGQAEWRLYRYVSLKATDTLHTTSPRALHPLS